ncbi:TrkA-N domain protein [Spirochaeta thermophila DSM 6578]|uniref:Trk system potassium uptake protein TrkA n=1 Tax=Winmispira thermophila (strain ATCC 700085 / DSM 6578 / Z-1203) TaxID=869211 RepID=G0GB29_WINT7|nr:Trk system potassium transporter TrkA [Spirochaeta thermophila]AEJ61053.1 TrkA-N domain protein [Spirochaeta thermophila DSM 6578]
MNIIIHGAGRVGFQLARTLIQEGHAITIIEQDPALARHAANLLDCFVLNEPGNQIETLRKAEVDKADYFVSVTDSDEINIISCGLAKSVFHTPKTIARVRKFDYSASEVLETPLFGIDIIINPEIETARMVVRAIQSGAMSPISLFETSHFQLQVIKVPPSSPFIKKPIQHLRAVVGLLFLVPLIQRGEAYQVPSGHTPIEEGDHLYILARPEDFPTLYKAIGITPEEIKKIVLVGGGELGCYILDMLNARREEGGFFRHLFRRIFTPQRYQFHIIDQDYDRCKYLAHRYPDATVSNVDISQEGFMEEGNLEGYDVVITATQSQELNLLTALYAKKVGVRKSIAVVHRIPFMHLGEQLGLDVTVSLNHAVLTTILKAIYQEKVHTIYPISGSPYELVETVILPTSPFIGKKIKELGLPGETLILLITRKEEQIIPSGDTELREGDKLVLIFNQTHRQKVEEFFA